VVRGVDRQTDQGRESGDCANRAARRETCGQARGQGGDRALEKQEISET